MAIPLWPAFALTAAAIAIFLAGRASAGLTVALFAIAVASAIPAHLLYDPPLASSDIRRLAQDRPVTIEGMLYREAERVPGGVRLYLQAERATLPGKPQAPATGRVRILVHDTDRYRIGERLRVTTRIRLPRNYGDPGEFDYEAYMAREGVAAIAFVPDSGAIERIGYTAMGFRTAIETIRRRIGAFIDSGLDYPERAEMRALVIGDRGDIDRGLRDVFALTGMAHLLVISGLHLGFVASLTFVLVRMLCAPFPRLMVLGQANKLAAAVSGAAALVYATIAGAHVSTLRALVMVLCYVVAVIAGRARDVVASLALAAMIICLAIPGSSRDIGFQLSFAAVLGIVIGMKGYAAWWLRIRERIAGRRFEVLYLAAGSLIGYMAVSFFALVATAPLTAFYFNQFSTVGLIANAVVVPVMALGGMIAGLFAAALSFCYVPAALIVLHAAGRALALGNYLAAMFVRLPDAWMRAFTPTLVELALVYGVIALWIGGVLTHRANIASFAGESRGRASWIPRMAGGDARPTDDSPRWGRVLAAILIAGLAIDAVWWIHRRYFDPRCRVTFLAVGQGDAAVVQFPGSAVMLIDGGVSFSPTADMGERVVAPFLWSRKIMHVDYLVLSHPERDHFGGFGFIVRNFHPSEFWTTGANSPDMTYRELLDSLAGAGVVPTIVNGSSPQRRIGGVMVRCLGPQPGGIGSRNNNSMVVELSWGRLRFLFTGDLEAPGENLLLQHDPSLHATVLKVPHHGSITSSSRAFVEAVRPEYAVISAGYHNWYHFPSAEVVARYEESGTAVLRTDLLGAIGFEADKSRMNMWTGRPVHPGSGRAVMTDETAGQ